ncbi:type 2 lantibiotic biosynthesis protein LanM [Butyrivibrio proteoclasticus]|uniref:Type 2 lantibiotic biosynthesis protein LanM n=2 Tax=Butyrivibrio proteoclasticus TaxID=43305 RepID=A0A1I5XBV3_9FIRM|nr:type 2 lantibiotic biosynthesis protein LanM [Butyrivibrio proteoclasticus]
MNIMIKSFIDEQIERVNSCPQANMLADKVFVHLENMLNSIGEDIVTSTTNGFFIEPDIYKSGTISTTLKEILRKRLYLVTDAFIEMLIRLERDKCAISDAIFPDKVYSKIEDVGFISGDTHNQGRSVTIIKTDIGIFVYKPRDSRVDKCINELITEYFDEYIGIPKCYACGKEYGVNEYIEQKRIIDDDDEVRKFFRNLGAVTAFAKILGTADMHSENILFIGAKPYIIDLETSFSPIFIFDDEDECFPNLISIKNRTLDGYGILPARINGMECSILMPTGNRNSPVLNGRSVTIYSYLDDYLNGYRTFYDTVAAKKEIIIQKINSFPKDIPIRVILRSTKDYDDYIRKLYHRQAVSDDESRRKTIDLLKRILYKNTELKFQSMIESEISQLLCGDIPYAYTKLDSCSIYMDKECVVSNAIKSSSFKHAIDIIQHLDDNDREFDIGFIKRAILQYPALLNAEAKENIISTSGEVCSERIAVNEAESILKEVYDLGIKGKDGHIYWGYNRADGGKFGFCKADLALGLCGMAVFSTACASVSADEKIKDISSQILDECIFYLEHTHDYIRLKYINSEKSPDLGEAEGIGGILTGLAVIRRYYDSSEIRSLQQLYVKLLDTIDYSLCNLPDRMCGLAGLLSTLCRFEEYRNNKVILKILADRLLELKTLECDGMNLWKSFSNNPCAISGAGHGQAGIAEALFSVSKILEDKIYFKAAYEGIIYEHELHNKYISQFGTWPDLRKVPTESYMNGYCSGPPGIGIMLERIKANGINSDVLMALEKKVKISIAKLPLNVRDHLCCGNSAIVEYYVSIGDYSMANKVLSAMQKRRDDEGSYRYNSYMFNNGATPSLFYGISGIGYEMLRFAFPEKIISVL